MRLIDADALADEMMKADMPPHDIGGRYQTGLMDARSMVITAPTIDPVKHGKWEVDFYMSMSCGVCRWCFEHYGGLEEEWNYCPHCGARMDGGEK